MPFWLQCCESKDIACRKRSPLLPRLNLNLGKRLRFGVGSGGGGALGGGEKTLPPWPGYLKGGKRYPTHKSPFSVEVAPYHAIYLIVMSQWIALSNFAEYK